MDIIELVKGVLKKYDDDLVAGAAIRDDLGRVISKTYSTGETTQKNYSLSHIIYNLVENNINKLKGIKVGLYNSIDKFIQDSDRLTIIDEFSTIEDVDGVKDYSYTTNFIFSLKAVVNYVKELFSKKVDTRHETFKMGVDWNSSLADYSKYNYIVWSDYPYYNNYTKRLFIIIDPPKFSTNNYLLIDKSFDELTIYIGNTTTVLVKPGLYNIINNVPVLVNEGNKIYSIPYGSTTPYIRPGDTFYLSNKDIYRTVCTYLVIQEAWDAQYDSVDIRIPNIEDLRPIELHLINRNLNSSNKAIDINIWYESTKYQYTQITKFSLECYFVNPKNAHITIYPDPELAHAIIHRDVYNENINN